MMQKIFWSLVGGLVVYEVVAVADKCEGDTISEMVWAATTKRPIIPFAFGVLMGHFFAQRLDSAPLPPPA